VFKNFAVLLSNLNFERFGLGFAMGSLANNAVMDELELRDLKFIFVGDVFLEGVN
jgi:hypothetical protein